MFVSGTALLLTWIIFVGAIYPSVASHRYFHKHYVSSRLGFSFVVCIFADISFICAGLVDIIIYRKYFDQPAPEYEDIGYTSE